MTPDPRPALLRAALDAAERGWPVFPLLPGTKRPALHGETVCPGTGDCSGGHRKWEQRATTDPDRIRQAWALRPFNVGIATGPAGLVVVDLDMPKTKDKSGSETPDGATTFRALCERAAQPAPTTRTVRTAGGGLHLYFAAPADARLHNTAGTIAPLVDTRAHGGYVVAAGSTTPEGAYQVTNPAPAAPLPEWLYSLLAPRQEVLTPMPSHSRASRRASAALTAESADVATAPEGTRNARLLAAARAMGRFVAWGDIDRHVVEEAFQGAAESAGLPSSECRATVRSALNWSIRTCRTRQTA
ncbi:bifunctional DNA primase/polymerase [Streptomyces sp. N2-109]|uniref:Bifunctional DNA primase/polymerase n=1 Tax=Streptomyces gossypii TaxID=2883101 RepID=A0ABT2JNP1_9ACTN|nr:bifunctional DNA primase/polymerase [Streptomyces gossypii]MCT2589497.1 bifunctional DNA primase/polymerase [Streptomyces gossypii]